MVQRIWTPGSDDSIDLPDDNDGDISSPELQKRRVKAWHGLQVLKKDIRRISTYGPQDERDQRLVQACLGLVVMELMSKEKGL